MKYLSVKNTIYPTFQYYKINVILETKRESGTDIHRGFLILSPTTDTDDDMKIQFTGNFASSITRQVQQTKLRLIDFLDNQYKAGYGVFNFDLEFSAL